MLDTDLSQRRGSGFVCMAKVIRKAVEIHGIGLAKIACTLSCCLFLAAFQGFNTALYLPPLYFFRVFFRGREGGGELSVLGPGWVIRVNPNWFGLAGACTTAPFTSRDSPIYASHGYVGTTRERRYYFFVKNRDHLYHQCQPRTLRFTITSPAI